jgi:hypothetical protein
MLTNLVEKVKSFVLENKSMVLVAAGALCVGLVLLKACG